jgi:hypothetical protein
MTSPYRYSPKGPETKDLVSPSVTSASLTNEPKHFATYLYRVLKKESCKTIMPRRSKKEVEVGRRRRRRIELVYWPFLHQLRVTNAKCRLWGESEETNKLLVMKTDSLRKRCKIFKNAKGIAYFAQLLLFRQSYYNRRATVSYAKTTSWAVLLKSANEV